MPNRQLAADELRISRRLTLINADIFIQKKEKKINWPQINAD